MRQKCYLTLATTCVWLISYKLHLSHMSSNVGQIFLTASLHRDHSILYTLVCVKIISHSSHMPLPACGKDKRQTIPYTCQDMLRHAARDLT